MKDKIRQIFFCVVALIVLLIFISGQQGCEQQTEAKKTGIDYSLVTGLDYLSAGRILQQGDSFYVGIKIENYDEKERTGQICIRDNIADTHGGILSEGSGECNFFRVRSADVIEKEVSSFGGKTIKKEINPGKTEIYFPEGAEYSFYGLPSMLQPYQGKLFVSLQYRETTQATATITIPDVAQPVLSQDPAPIVISVSKSIHKKQDGYKVDLNIILKKQQKARIFSPDFSQENVTYFNIEMMPQTIQCTISGEPVGNLIEFENERLIKCSTLIYTEGEIQQSYPLVIILDYGVAIEKDYPFSIETKIE